MSTQSSTRTRFGVRHGTVYLAVLVTAMTVTAIGLSALALQRVARDGASATADAGAARTLARSGIELALQLMLDDPNWREATTPGLWFDEIAVGAGAVSVRVEPVEGTDYDDQRVPVLITSTGRRGVARQVLRAVAARQPRSLNCLEISAYTDGDVFTGLSARIDGDTVGAAGSFDAVLSDIRVDVEALSISGSAFWRSRTSGADPREFPDPDTVLDYYLEVGTHIDVGALDISGGGAHRLRRSVLAPGVNPYGSELNELGVYIIDAQGETLVIQDCRIWGTLVVLNPGPDSRVAGSVNIEPYTEGFPSLLVDGRMDFHVRTDALKESMIGTNLNPAAAPYNGSSNSNLGDVYPSIIRGLVYIGGVAFFREHHTRIDGVLLAGGGIVVNGGARVRFDYDDTSLRVPPPGFFDPYFAIVSGTWDRPVD